MLWRRLGGRRRCGRRSMVFNDRSHFIGAEGAVTKPIAECCLTTASGRVCHAMRVKAPIGLVLLTCVIVSLGIMNDSRAGGLIEGESNIGSTEIDKIVLKEGYNPGTYPPNESSPLSSGIRAYLVERAKQGGAATVEAALSEASASCRVSMNHTRHCEIRRYRVLRSADLIGARSERADWIISISYARRGNDIQNIHVTYTITGELIK
jgi:hypothetical protein